MAENDIVFSVGADGADLNKYLTRLMGDIVDWSEKVQDVLSLAIDSGKLNEQMEGWAQGLDKYAKDVAESGQAFASALSEGLPLMEQMGVFSEALNDLEDQLWQTEKKRKEVIAGIYKIQQDQTSELRKQLKLTDDMTSAEVVEAEAVLRGMEREAAKESAVAKQIRGAEQSQAKARGAASWLGATADWFQVPGGGAVRELENYNTRLSARAGAGEEQAKTLRETVADGQQQIKQVTQTQINEQAKIAIKNDKAFEKMIDKLDDISKNTKDSKSNSGMGR